MGISGGTRVPDKACFLVLSGANIRKNVNFAPPSKNPSILSFLQKVYIMILIGRNKTPYYQRDCDDLINFL
jgi:hypothetical protein